MLIILLVLDDHYHGIIRRHIVLIFSIFSWQENEMFNPGKGSHPRTDIADFLTLFKRAKPKGSKLMFKKIVAKQAFWRNIDIKLA